MDADGHDEHEPKVPKQPPMQGKATLAKISGDTPGKLQDLACLNLANRGISELDDLAICLSLRRLDLRRNYLTSVSSLKSLTLTWLHLADNEIESIQPLLNMYRLNVLNISKNKIVLLEGLDRLDSLKALIVSHNQLRRFENVGRLSSLNALVLAHNNIESARGLVGLPALAKLSLSHNSLRAFPDLKNNTDLKELRLNDNKIVDISTNLYINQQLKFIDLGNNIISSMTSLEVLKSLPHLTFLNLKGNPIAKAENYKEKVLELLPNLFYLDGQPTPRNTKVIKKQEHKKLVKLREEKKVKKKDKQDTPSKSTEKESTPKKKDTKKSPENEETRQKDTHTKLAAKSPRRVEPESTTPVSETKENPELKVTKVKKVADVSKAEESDKEKTKPKVEEAEKIEPEVAVPKKPAVRNSFDVVAQKLYGEKKESAEGAKESQDGAEQSGLKGKKKKSKDENKRKTDDIIVALEGKADDSGVLMIKENKKKRKGAPISIEEWVSSQSTGQIAGGGGADGWD